MSALAFALSVPCGAEQALRAEHPETLGLHYLEKGTSISSKR